MTALAQSPTQPAVLVEFANRYGVDPSNLAKTLKATCFKQPKKRDAPDVEVSDEQLVALLVVANQYNLNPWTKEIYAFPDNNGIVPIVGIDGWHRNALSHPHFDGVEVTGAGEFRVVQAYRPVWDNGKKVLRPVEFFGPEWVEVTVRRKDWSQPYKHVEYLADCARDTDPWRMSPFRMLRNRAFAQAYRVAFGLSGIHEEDEAEVVLASRQDFAALPAPKVGVTVEDRVAGAKTAVVAEETPEQRRARVESAVKAAKTRQDATAVPFRDAMTREEFAALVNTYHPKPVEVAPPEPAKATEAPSSVLAPEVFADCVQKMKDGEWSETDVYEFLEATGKFDGPSAIGREMHKVKTAAGVA